MRGTDETGLQLERDMGLRQVGLEIGSQRGTEASFGERDAHYYPQGALVVDVKELIPRQWGIQVLAYAQSRGAT